MSDFDPDYKTNDILREILSELQELNRKLDNPIPEEMRCFHEHRTLGVKCGLELGHAGDHVFKSLNMDATWPRE